MKGLLKTVSVLLVLLALGCSARSNWADGWYTGTGEGVHGTIELSVSVEKGKIAEIRIDKQHETEGVSDIALEEIPQSIIKAQSTDVDTTAGASVTSGGIIEAVDQALAKAAEAKQ